MAYEGRWWSEDVAFGLHYDLHAGPKDTDIGTHVKLEELAPDLGLMAPQWIQTDCKGVTGMTSWPSKTPGATTSPGVKGDALRGWVQAAHKLGVPIHGHYCGLWDQAAWDKNPSWRVVPNPNTPDAAPGRICPRSEYADKLMIPQLIEAVESYGVNGFWVDGEIACYVFCYCPRCKDAFRQLTNINEPPIDVTDTNWLKWVAFQRSTLEEFVTHYVEAVHAHNPNVLICDNYMYTVRHPGEPVVPTDWLSGDVWQDLDEIRCEARFMATRGRSWDIMSWAFDKSAVAKRDDPEIPYDIKSVARLEQEAAIALALGGHYQIYETTNLRDGRLVPWRMERLGKVGDFFKERQEICVDSEPIRQVAVLHSEYHLRSQPVPDLFWGYDLHGIRGALFSLLEESLSADLVDEWALKPVLSQYPLVVAPEQDNMSKTMVQNLKDYVVQGGRLLVTGAAAYARFGAEFLGVSSQEVLGPETFYIRAGDGSAPIFSPSWRSLQPTTAAAFSSVGRTPLVNAELMPFPPVTVNQVGSGKVAYVPFELFHFYSRTRYPLVRVFVGAVVRALNAVFPITVQAPPSVDVVQRHKGNAVLIHLLNRNEGMLSSANPQGEPPPAGPIVVTAELPTKPSEVKVLYEQGKAQWTITDNTDTKGVTVKVIIPQISIHATVVITH
jgi:hypothetical protein